MINILSKETIDKIAAGEVIERPENVVKELLENAVDSGADSISTEIREGGLSLIRVTDNGCGMGKEDIPLAFLRHATSKLKDASDLSHIETMGFRGEALASICGVSETELVTREASALYGYRYEISGGREKALSEVGAPEGTSIIVRNLFYNIPARKKFLRTPQTEAGRIADIVEKTALANPGISFRLVSDGRNLLHTAGNGRLKDVIFSIYGREITENLIEVSCKKEAVTITGYIGKPVITRARRDLEVYFVNGRYVRSQIIEKAVEDAYKPFLMLHRFPFVMLMLHIDPEQVDVNVHPKKMEVRFSSRELVYQAVYEAIAAALSGRELIQAVSPRKETAEGPTKGVGTLPVEKEERAEPFEEKRNEKLGEKTGLTSSEPVYSSASKTARGAYPDIHAAWSLSASGASPRPKEEGLSDQASGFSAEKETQSKQQQLFPEEKFLSPKSVPRFRLIGQVFQTYWLIEFADKLYIIDQHAAHEKVNYERMMKALRERRPLSQQLLPPIRLELSLREAELVKSYCSAFADLGYEIEEAGEREFLVRAVPANLCSVATDTLLRELIDGLSEEYRSSLAPDVLRERVATMSCKAAVKGNRDLSEEEMRALIGELLQLDNPYACPHGRPTIISMSKYELDRKFKRIL